MSKRFLYILLISFFASCSSKNHRSTQEELPLECNYFIKVSFEELIANPEYYHERKVRISGYFYYGFEEFAIYKENRRRPGEGNGLWIEFDKKLNLYEGNKYEKFNKRRIDLIGVFNAQQKGHLNQYIGEMLVMCVTEH